MSKNNLLELRDLTTQFTTKQGVITAVNKISFSLKTGETIGIVGESGSGKTQLALSIMGLLSTNAKTTGSILYCGQELINMPDKEYNKIRGKNIAMIFQNPMTALNPYLTIATQMTEVLIHHQGLSYSGAFNVAKHMLDIVAIPEPVRRLKMYPHEFSGGMQQRVMIAMALLCKPDLLIADEPTTALDVTIQAQILDLIKDLKKEIDMSVIFITHDLGVVAGIADTILVMYAGKLVESGSVDDVFSTPKHPYSQGLLNSRSRLSDKILSTITGNPPDLKNLPSGCSFHPRCPYAFDLCINQAPPLRAAPQGAYACYLDKLPKQNGAI